MKLPHPRYSVRRMMFIVAILAVAGVSGRQMIVLGLLAVTGVYAVVGLGLLKQYQVDRLTVFLDPESGTSQGTAYNQQQSTQTIAHGRSLGEGYLSGSQTQGGFVPEQEAGLAAQAMRVRGHRP